MPWARQTCLQYSVPHRFAAPPSFAGRPPPAPARLVNQGVPGVAVGLPGRFPPVLLKTAPMGSKGLFTSLQMHAATFHKLAGRFHKHLARLLKQRTTLLRQRQPFRRNRRWFGKLLGKFRKRTTELRTSAATLEPSLANLRVIVQLIGPLAERTGLAAMVLSSLIYP